MCPQLVLKLQSPDIRFYNKVIAFKEMLHPAQKIFEKMSNYSLPGHYSSVNHLYI